MFRKRFALFEGEPGAAGGAPAAGTPAAGEGTPASGAGTAGAGTPTGGASSENLPNAWLQSIADADLRTYAEGKGFKDPGEAIKAMREAEVKYAAPAKPEDYQIGDTEFAKTASAWFHELGVPPEMAKSLTEKWNAHVEQATKAEQDAQAAQLAKGEADMAALKTEWADGYDKNMELGRQAMRKFGVAPELIDKLAGKMGDAEVVRMFSKIGASLSEGTLNPGGAGGSGAALTPEQRAAKFYSNTKS